ncbi:putative nuclease HARBI1 [Ischnura elegans]|uniref:putative nuclease HARBI1 n=1 Tax=Ischnura elegans TaxID=197161 RepID=UPI001ED8A667|nr:putative nuclease HARBI1 [Ischnura elegans]
MADIRDVQDVLGVIAVVEAVPSSAEAWRKIAEGFSGLWNFPNCLGALDGKHIEFRPPRSMGSYYYNYKGGNSIVLLALVDAQYKFLFADVGCNGRISDGGVYRDSVLSEAISRNSFNFPPSMNLPGMNQPVPYVIVADDAFPLTKNIMKPYKSRHLSVEQKVYNYRLSRARRTVENAFGILSNRFRILLKKIELSPEKVENITLAACTLHNFLIEECGGGYTASCEDGTSGGEITNLGRIARNVGNRSSNESQGIRDLFRDYFNGNGSVPWQWDAIEKFNY